MRNGKKLVSTACRFALDRGGNFAMLMGILLMTLMLVVGFGVNIAQMYHVKSNLLAALDSAVTSTARDITTGAIVRAEARASVERFFNANSDAKFADQTLFVLDDIVIDDAARTVEASAHAYVNTAFPFFGADPKVTVSSAALYSDKKVEIAMMLDITGSMQAVPRQGTNKIGDLKNAAKNAVNLALAQNSDPQNPRIRVAIVPYAQAVNTGALANETVFVEKAGGSNLPPPFDAAQSASSGSRPDNCATERKMPNGAADYSDDSPSSERFNLSGKAYPAKVNRDDRMTDCPPAAIIPLTANAAALTATINNFVASGTTAGGIGIQWTYYMLSPDWRAAISNAGLGNGPANVNSAKVSKVAILMTDGEFNTAFTGASNDQANVSKTNAQSICTNMKRDGIEVYTIGFQLVEAGAKTVLKNCSSPDMGSVKHYYEVSTGPELDHAFQEIVSNTERLALTR